MNLPQHMRRARLFLRSNMTSGELLRLDRGTALVYSRRSPAKDTVNQDGAAVIPLSDGRIVMAVADGVGGHRGGQLAAAIALDALRQALSEPVENLRGAILDSLERANQKINNLGGAATTIAVATLIDGAVRTFNVGDSAVLVIGQRGRVKLQTVSHSPVGYALESGYLPETDAMEHPERHLISNVIGAPDMNIDIGSPRKLAPRDTLLIASDGLFDNFYLNEIVEQIRKGSLKTVAARLSTRCLDRMKHNDAEHPSKPDDLTFVLFRRTRT